MPRCRCLFVEVRLPDPVRVEVATSPPLVVGVTRSDAVPVFGGDYTVTPGDEAQTIPCAGLRMSTDITINPVPSNYGRISWNGSTLTVS